MPSLVGTSNFHPKPPKLFLAEYKVVKKDLHIREETDNILFFSRLGFVISVSPIFGIRTYCIMS